MQLAPCVSLNISSDSIRDLAIVAILGMAIQLGMLAFSAASVYHPSFKNRFQKSDSAVEQWAFPMMATGTGLLVIGMIICSRIVGNYSDEFEILPAGKQKMHLLWVQREHKVGDQAFDSFILLPGGRREPGHETESERIILSRRVGLAAKPLSTTGIHNAISSLREDSKKGSTKVFISSLKEDSNKGLIKEFISTYWNTASSGVLFSLIGFGLQFQGLRSLNFYSSVAQLASIVTMATLRAWLRRGITAKPLPIPVSKDYELDRLALNLKTVTGIIPDQGPKSDGEWWLEVDPRRIGKDTEELEDHNGLKETNGEGPNSKQPTDTPNGIQPREDAQRIVNIRRRLGELTEWRGPASEAATALARSIGVVKEMLVQDGTTDWYLNAGFKSEATSEVQMQDILLSDSQDKIEAALSLWLYHIHQLSRLNRRLDGHPKNKIYLRLGDDENPRELELTWQPNQKTQTCEVVRVLGRYSKALERNIGWWVGDSVRCWKSPLTPDSNDGQKSDKEVGPNGKSLTGLIGANKKMEKDDQGITAIIFCHVHAMVLLTAFRSI